MTETTGLISAFDITPKGEARALGWKGVRGKLPAKGWRWIHLERSAQEAVHWLKNESGLEEHIVSALLSAETRPRCDITKNGMLLILRGVNLNPQSKPEDMVSIRIWVTPDLIVSTRSRRILAVTDLREAYQRGDGPESIGDFLIDLSNGLLDRMGRVIGDLDDELDALEEYNQEVEPGEARSHLLRLRRRAILLRRYLAPQREALTQLSAARTPYFDDYHRGPLREGADRVSRYVEDLDAMRERAAVIQDEVSTRLAEQMNTAMYRLSIVATIFLPLSLFTGLLGINVAGIPGGETDWAFWAVCALLALLALGTLAAFRLIERK